MADMDSDETAVPTGATPAPADGAQAEVDFELLERLLEEANPEDAMVVEELDGFLAALACCAEAVPPEEYLPEIFGFGDHAEVVASASPELLQMIEQHRRQVDSALDEQRFVPVLAHYDDDEPDGVAWAVGFLRGGELRPDGWDALLEEAEFADALDAAELLASSLDDDSPDAGGTLTRREREAAIDQMLADVADIHEFFRPFRKAGTLPQDMRVETVRREHPKVGRNDPCPCGSGRKYKLCHGR